MTVGSESKTAEQLTVTEFHGPPNVVFIVPIGVKYLALTNNI